MRAAINGQQSGRFAIDQSIGAVIYHLSDTT